MKIERPYDAKDNDINVGMFNTLTKYINKIGCTIDSVEIFEACVMAQTSDGRKFRMSKAEGCRVGTTFNQRNFWYMTETVNGKQHRVKKSEW